MNMILSEAWQLYKADKQIQGYSSQTLKAYKIQSALFIKHLGNVEIEDYNGNYQTVSRRSCE